jgi:hypothetical protein
MNIEELIKQAPIGISNEEIIKVYEKNNWDKMNTLMELWDIEDKKPVKKEDKWSEIRETCDAFDNEMERVISHARKKMANNINGDIKL